MATTTFRTTALALLHRLEQGLSAPSAELVYTSHPRWPLPRTATKLNFDEKRPLRISVLDASFNPPTLAHLALANSRRPISKQILAGVTDIGEDDGADYDARLLLLSVRNADKSLKPGDATYIQRLEMMNLLAKDVELHVSSEHNSTGSSGNVAIGIIDEPTFVGKSSCLLQFLKQRFSNVAPEVSDIHVQLYFILGLDTLERLFTSHYYPSEPAMLSSLRTFLSPSGDDAHIVWAHRISSSTSTSSVHNNPLMEDFVKSGRILMINIGEETSTYSSTAVRASIRQLGLETESQHVWRNLVPSSVADYVVQARLYASSQ